MHVSLIISTWFSDGNVLKHVRTEPKSEKTVIINTNSITKKNCSKKKFEYLMANGPSASDTSLF